jgi:hypothetical protein
MLVFVRQAAAHLAACVAAVAVAAGGANAKVVAMIAKDHGRVVVSVHDGYRLRWWNTTEPGAAPPPFHELKQENRNCDVFLYEQRLRWTADGRAELLCSHRAWWFDGAKLAWWDVPHHQGNFDTGIAPLPKHRVAYCESPTPHGGTSPYCAQFDHAGTSYVESCRDKKCRDRALGGQFGFHHYLRNDRILLAYDRLELDDERTGKRLFYVGDASLHDYSAIVSPDETLVLTSDADDYGNRQPGTATLWSLRDGSRVQRIPGKVVWGAFSPDTRRLAVFVDAEIRIYALRPFRLVAKVTRDVPVTAVAWSDDGRTLLVGDVNDGIARINPKR